MNSYICTAKIIEEPKWLRSKSTALSIIILVRPNNSKNKSCYSIRAIAKGKVAKTIFDNHRKNNLIIVEGYIYMKKKSTQQNSNKKKYIVMKIQKIHSILINI